MGGRRFGLAPAACLHNRAPCRRYLASQLAARSSAREMVEGAQGELLFPLWFGWSRRSSDMSNAGLGRGRLLGPMLEDPCHRVCPPTDESARMAEVKQTRIQIRNRNNILKSATAAFAQNGFKGATVEDIASRADMSQPNLHHYFKTKLDLYQEVLSTTLDIWFEPIGGITVEGDPAAEISSYIRRKIEMSRLHPEASRVFAQEMLAGAPILKGMLETQVKAQADRFATIVAAWINAGRIREVDPYHLLFTIWSATQHYADFAPQVIAVLGKRSLGRKEFDAAGDALTALILNGLIIEQT